MLDASPDGRYLLAVGARDLAAGDVPGNPHELIVYDLVAGAVVFSQISIPEMRRLRFPFGM